MVLFMLIFHDKFLFQRSNMIRNVAKFNLYKLFNETLFILIKTLTIQCLKLFQFLRKN